MRDVHTSSDGPLARGRIEVGLAGEGSFRWAATELTAVVEAVRLRLDLSPVAAAALGRCLSGAALLLRLAEKTPSRVLLEVAGNGPLRRVLAEADQGGNLRGMVGEPRVEVPSDTGGKLAVGRAVGQGYLRVIREFENGSYQSQVELVSGEIGEDLAHFLDQSEQTRSAVLLGVLARPDGVAGAGGLMIEVVPGASGEGLSALETNLANISAISRLIEGGGVEAALKGAFAGLDWRSLQETELVYRCRCSRRRLQRQMVLMAPDDREYLRSDEGVIDVHCVFCGARYRFQPEELLEGA